MISRTVLAGVRPATVRTQVTVPLRFPDGYATSARVFTFDGLADGKEHLALGLGDWQGALADPAREPLVRPHSECLTGDVFGSERCDCGPQLREAAERITATGVFVTDANARYLAVKRDHTGHTLDLPLAG